MFSAYPSDSSMAQNQDPATQLQSQRLWVHLQPEAEENGCCEILQYPSSALKGRECTLDTQLLPHSLLPAGPTRPLCISLHFSFHMCLRIM